MVLWAKKALTYPIWGVLHTGYRLDRFKLLEGTQWSTEKRLRSRQWRRLLSAIEYASLYSPYYKQNFSETGLSVQDILSPSDLTKIPITTSQDLEGTENMFISSRFSIRALKERVTRCATGMPLSIYLDDECVEMRKAAMLRSDRWAGWEVGVTRGVVCDHPPQTKNLKGWLRNRLFDKVFYLDALDLSEASMQRFSKKCVSARQFVLFGQPHAIYLFAKFLASEGITTVQPKAIVSTSMVLLDHERTCIEQVFGCSVLNRYASKAFGLLASECNRHEGLHINIDDVFLEVVDEHGAPVNEGVEGRIVVTDLNNRGMPLLRYDTGDVGVLSKEPCSCGRGMPMLEKVSGQVTNLLKHADGHTINGAALVDRIICDSPEIDELQVVQKTLNDVTVNIVRGENYQPEIEEQVGKTLRAVLDNHVNISLVYVNNIPREACGRYLFAKCEMARA